ncbi:MAG: M1 family aminopeptidase [candidate division Zixibacteria bacterium]
MNKITFLKTELIISLILFISTGALAQEGSFDVESFSKELGKRTKQTVLTGLIDSLTIKRGAAEFRMGPGKLTLFNFDAYRPSAMVFEGEGIFNYAPPNQIERGEILWFTGNERIETEFKSVCFFFTVELEPPMDTASLRREVVSKNERRRLVKSQNKILEHLGFHTQTRMTGDILTKSPGYFFLAELKTSDKGEIILVEDMTSDDYFSLYKIGKISREKKAIRISGHTPDNTLVSRRGIVPFDITRYNLNTSINEDGKIKSHCWIHFKMLRRGWPYLKFHWSGKNTIESAKDSNGDELTTIQFKEENGFGIILNTVPEIGIEDSLEITFEGKPLIYEWNIYYSDNTLSWYPKNIIPDRAGFDISFSIPSKYKLVVGGEFVEFDSSDGHLNSKWIVEDNALELSFSMGAINSAITTVNNDYAFIVNAPMESGWGARFKDDLDSREDALMEVILGLVFSIGWMDELAETIGKDLVLCERITGCKPFKKAVSMEVPYDHSRGSLGLICLSSEFRDKLRDFDDILRGHEAAHQWWGQMVGIESYRDEWIIEGLSEYFGYMAHQGLMDVNEEDSTLTNWRDDILSSSGADRPIILGSRLKLPDADHYNDILFKKSGYVFHMIRYLLWDYDHGSDARFLDFISDLIDGYSWKTITTVDFKKTLEKHVSVEMDWFFDQWVYGTAIPQYTFNYEIENVNDSTYAIIFHVEQTNVPDNFAMLVPITVLAKDGRFVNLKAWIDQPENNIDLPNLPFKPKKIIFNTFDAVLCKVDYK